MYLKQTFKIFILYCFLFVCLFFSVPSGMSESSLTLVPNTSKEYDGPRVTVSTGAATTKSVKPTPPPMALLGFAVLQVSTRAPTIHIRWSLITIALNCQSTTILEPVDMVSDSWL